MNATELVASMTFKFWRDKNFVDIIDNEYVYFETAEDGKV